MTSVHSTVGNSLEPLSLATIRGARVGIELLITKGADVNVRDNAGQTSLANAITMRYEDVAKGLRQHGGK